ncbi:putative DNA endonuclease SmrA [Roseivivax sp. THAF40]|uniref:Smr/MutS family protein n=1 Tax=unclassified Roseivivax TaxID=2639302 RepID=UPI0012694EC5|nr:MULTISPECIES: Smr/MutS family protein [unclassified Roseivivax]QFS84737.1 putative DNA endonuclease SmrA [Roseivivax sp. THAF197b]QFT48564.1 putative DNA endonuclease SmrA [Roseivivax sp. THAF40]
MSRRKLRPDELELWGRVAGSARKLETQGKLAKPSGAAYPIKAPKPAPSAVPSIERFDLGQRGPAKSNTWSLPETTASRLSRDPVKMDAKAFTRMKRGKLKPEARIDLHGMTLDRAHPALIGFIHSAQSRGLRLVLVITGKGQREDPYDAAPRRRGVLKSQVPQWLRMPPISNAVLQISEAHQRHGGGGAYYVYLRRFRS